QAALVRDSGVFQQQTAVLCGDGWIELAYRRFDNHVSHQEGATQLDNIGPSTGSAFGFADPKDAGGEVNGPPTLVCSRYRTLELWGGGSDDALWHARSHGFSWSSWQEENEHLFGSLFAWKIEGEAPPAVVGGDGDVFVVARAAGSGKGVLVYNQYSAERADNTPAALVDWRGFARVADRELFGTPSVAIQSRELALGIRGTDGNVWLSSLGDALRADLRGLAGGALNFPFEAVIVSGGPRTLEVLDPGAGGSVRPISRLKGCDQQEKLLGAPVPIGSPIAAAGSAGQIELVGIGQDHNLYHWRFVGGIWRPAAVVGGPAYSAPALVATGAGQLKLFAVGANLQLRRWRFAGARWSDLGPVAPNLR